MKARASLLTLLLLGVLAPPAAADDPPGFWRAYGPSTGRSMQLISAAPGGPIYASLVLSADSPPGVYRSIDGGDTWEAAVNGLPDGFYPQSIAFDPRDPDVAYTAASEVYKTTDGGGTWAPAGAGLPDAFVNSLVVDPVDATYLYAATGEGVFRSDDEGRSWSPAGSGLPDGAGTRALAISPSAPDTVYVAVFTPSQSPAWRVYRSTNAGAAWSPTGLAQEGFIYGQEAAPTDASTIFASSNGGAKRSTNGGASWVAVSNGLPSSPVREFEFLPGSTTSLFAGTDTGLYFSSDAGGTWKQVPGLSSGGGRSAEIVTDEAGSSTMFAVGHSGGTYRSENLGESWTLHSSGFPANVSIRPVAAPATVPGTVYAGSYAGSTAYVSSNGGRRWQSGQAGSGSISALAAHPTNPDVAIAGTYSGGGVYRTVDGGDTWKHVALPGSPSLEAVAYARSNPQVVYAGGILNRIDAALPTVVLRSADGGETWTSNALNTSGFPPYCVVLDLAVDPTNADTVYAAVGYCGMFKSIDGGRTWLSINAGIVGYSVLGVTIDPVTPSTVYAAVFNVGRTTGGVYKSTLGGIAWLPTGLLGPSVGSIAVDPTNPQRLYASLPSDDQMLMTSADGGASWTSMTDGLDPNFKPVKLAIDSTGKRLYASTYGRGVFVTMVA